MSTNSISPHRYCWRGQCAKQRAQAKQSARSARRFRIAPNGQLSAHRPQSSSSSGVICTGLEGKPRDDPQQSTVRAQEAAIRSADDGPQQQQPTAEDQDPGGAAESKETDKGIESTDDEITRRPRLGGEPDGCHEIDIPESAAPAVDGAAAVARGRRTTRSWMAPSGQTPAQNTRPTSRAATRGKQKEEQHGERDGERGIR